MFNTTPQHPYVVIYKHEQQSKIMGFITASSKEEAINKILPSSTRIYLKGKFRARRNIIHRAYRQI